MDREPFVSTILKLNRADDQLHAIHAEINDFLKGHIYDPSPEYDRQRRAVIRVKNLQQPPPRIGVLIGEYLHNTRSALDHAAYDLAELATGTPLPDEIGRTSAFPIFNSGPRYRERSKNGPTRKSGLYKVRGMSRDMRATVERLQPYHRRKNPDASLLWVLEELTNVEKHRLPPITAAALFGSQFRLTVNEAGPFAIRGIEVCPGPLKRNAVIARFLVENPANLEMHVEAHTVMDIVFDKRSEVKAVRGESVIGMLAAIGKFVDERVLPALARGVPGMSLGITEWPPPEPPLVRGAYTENDQL